MRREARYKTVSTVALGANPGGKKAIRIPDG
jgi:hypothetical protein